MRWFFATLALMVIFGALAFGVSYAVSAHNHPKTSPPPCKLGTLINGVECYPVNG